MHWLSSPLIKISPQRVLIPILFKCTIMLHDLASMQKQQGRKQGIHRASLRLGIIRLSPCCCCSVMKLCPTLRPCEPQHTRLPCPSLSPRVCSNSCPLSQWHHPTISSSVILFSSCLQSFPAWECLCKWVSSSHQVAKVLEFQLQHQFFQWIFRTDFHYDWLVGSPCSPRDSQRVFSNTTVQKHQFFGTQLSL